jgi:hypothetical protein
MYVTILYCSVSCHRFFVVKNVQYHSHSERRKKNKRKLVSTYIFVFIFPQMLMFSTKRGGWHHVCFQKINAAGTMCFQHVTAADIMCFSK